MVAVLAYYSDKFKYNMNKLIIPSLLLFCLMEFGCNHSNKNDQSTTSAFCINDTLWKSIQIDTAKNLPVLSELKLTGRISFDEDKVVKVSPFMGGIVEKLNVELGDFVEKGKVLAEIRSTEITDYENQLISAKANLAVAEKNLQVAQDMFNSKLSSQQEVIIAKNEVEKSKSELDKVQRIIKLYGGGYNSNYYTIKAPISGYIVEKKITENMQFTTDNLDNLFTISNLDNLWTIANVFESDISKVTLGQDATVTAMAYPNKPFQGKVDKIFNVLDEDSRVEKIKIKIKNTEHFLKPEMFAYVNIKYNENTNMLAVPSSSIVFDNSKNYVVVFKNKCDLEIRQVLVYKNFNNKTYLSEGISEGEKVVSDSQLIIYNALND
jgi:cobalt-zinc-cadmium efflux system membrane fusion protein